MSLNQAVVLGVCLCLRVKLTFPLPVQRPEALIRKQNPPSATAPIKQCFPGAVVCQLQADLAPCQQGFLADTLKRTEQLLGLYK